MTLDQHQQAAVSSTSKNVLVIAGAGSGKTRVLVERINKAEWVGVELSDIEAITYTNAAADEIRRRLPGDIGYCGTIHGFAYRLVSAHHEALDLPDKIGILDSEQEDDLIVECLKFVGNKSSIEGVRRCLKYGSYDPKMEATITEFTNRTLGQGMLTYDQLIELAANVVNKETEPMSLLLVDEYQDCTEATHRLCVNYPAERKFFVGDPRQAIFGFAGGNPNCMSELVRDPTWQKFDLLTNYRSGRMIVEGANDIVTNGKPLTYLQAPDGTFQIYNSGSAVGATGFAESLIARAKANRKTSAVLCWSNFDVDTIRCGLKARGVQLHYPRGVPIDWSTCRRLIALCADPENNANAYWFLKFTRGERHAQEIRQRSTEEYTSINKLTLKIPLDLTVHDLPFFLQKAGIMDASLYLVGQAIKTLDETATPNDLFMALDRPFDEPNPDNLPVVTTIHKAKGREWDSVCVVMKKPETDEQKRIAYVGVTRAKTDCMVCWIV